MKKLQDQNRQEFIDKILIPYGYKGDKGTTSKFWVKTSTNRDGTKERERFVLNQKTTHAEKEINSKWVRTKSMYYRDMFFPRGGFQLKMIHN